VGLSLYHYSLRLGLPQKIPQRGGANLHLPGHDPAHPRLGPGGVQGCQLGAAAGGASKVGGGVGGVQIAVVSAIAYKFRPGLALRQVPSLKSITKLLKT